MTRFASIVVAGTFAAALSASQPLAQDRTAMAPERPVRVQLGVNFFMPGSPNDTGEEAERVREQARRIVYEMAAKECAVLQSVLARDCRLEAMNVNLNRQAGQALGGFFVNGNMTYQITLR